MEAPHPARRSPNHDTGAGPSNAFDLGAAARVHDLGLQAAVELLSELQVQLQPGTAVPKPLLCALGGTSPYAANQHGKVISMPECKQWVGFEVRAFQQALAVAADGGAVRDMGAEVLRLPTLPEEVAAEEQERERERCVAGQEAAAAVATAAGAGGVAVVPPNGKPHAGAEPAVEVVKRRRLAGIERAAQRLDSVERFVDQGGAERTWASKRAVAGTVATIATATAPAAAAPPAAAAATALGPAGSNGQQQQEEEGREGGGGGAGGCVDGHGVVEDGESTRLDEDEVLLQVQVHHPMMPGRAPQEFLVAGCTPLGDLRDAVHCATDANVANNAPDWLSGSAMLYIEGVFYIDRQDPAWVDYSRPLREFCSRHGVQPPGGGCLHRGSLSDKVETDPESGFGVADMREVTFGELCLQANAPRSKYLYLHQGLCEHAVTVSLVRRLHKDDPQMACEYPATLSRGYHKTRLCEACGLRPTTRVTLHDPQAHGSPAFWCGECYEMMHTDEEGNLLRDDFQVFTYAHE